jgi:hypothetical protein
MMKWMRRLLLFFAGVWVFLALAALYSIHLARGTPAWYEPNQFSSEQNVAAANDSDQKLAELLSYANDIAAAQKRKALGRDAISIAPKTIQFSQLQINAFLDKWQGLFGSSLRARLGRFLTDCRIVLLDDRLVLAGTLHEMGYLNETVASIEFAPRLDDQGRLWLSIEQVFSGRLPIPSPLVAKPENRLRERLEEDVFRLQPKAAFDASGMANHAAVDLAGTKMILASLNDQPADAIFFIPCELTDPKHAAPVRLTNIQISDQAIILTIRPLSDEELAGLSNPK